MSQYDGIIGHFDGRENKNTAGHSADTVVYCHTKTEQCNGKIGHFKVQCVTTVEKCNTIMAQKDTAMA